MTELEKEKRRIQIIEDRKNREEYVRQRRQRRDRRIAAGLIIFFVITAFAYSFWNRKFQTYEELTSTPNSEANYTQIAVYRDGYMKYSKDGISCLDSKEQILWTEAYNMEKPFISVADNYAVVADLEGNEVQLYDENGKVGDYSMPYPLKRVQAADQGVFCVVLEGDGANYIRLYNREGKILTDIKTQIENNGYPLAVAISSDGQKMAASFYCVDGINSKNVLSFYNFGEGGKGQSGNLVGTYQFEQTLIPKVEFMDDETVCAIGDNQTILYHMKDKPKKIRQIEFEKEIKSVFSSNQYIGYICENEEDDVQAGKVKPYQVMIYNKNGRLKESFGWEKLYETVELKKNILFCYTGSECAFVRINGIEFFHQDMGQNIVNILPTSNRKEMVIVYSTRSVRIRLKNSFHTSEVEETEENQDS